MTTEVKGKITEITNDSRNNEITLTIVVDPSSINGQFVNRLHLGGIQLSQD